MSVNQDGAGTESTTSIVDASATANIDDGNAEKVHVSFTLTMFNILCSAIGIGVLFLPSTLCGAGLFLGVASILIIGLAADWSSRALVEVTTKSKSKSLDDMFRNVLGNWAGHVYSFSVFFMLIGALSIYILLMGIMFNDFYASIKDVKKAKLMNWRLMSLMFSLICGLSLFFKDLKALSYVSIVKIGVILFILLVSCIYAPGEYNLRRELPGHEKGGFWDEFPATPTLLGFMKAMGSWQTAYLFHMGVSEMYFAMERRSYSRWSKVSRISVFLVALLNVAFAVIGYLATADQLVQSDNGGAENMCATPEIFLSLYQTNSTGKKVLMSIARFLIMLILMASYPLIFFFLKNYSLLIVKNVFPSFYESKPKAMLDSIIIFGVWTLILLCSLITEDPFTVTNLMVSVVGTISVFLMPVLAWIEINGGFGYVFSLGLYQRKENEKNKNAVDIEKTDEEEIKPSIMGMCAAQSIFWLSWAFIIIGLFVSSMELYQKAKAGKGIGWRQQLKEFPKVDL